MKVLYTAEASATGDGRNGHVTSSDRLIDTDVRSPVELGGKGGATNPEQLFAAGYAGCFHSSLKAAARGLGVTLDGTSVTVSVGLLKEDGAFSLAVTITADLPGTAREQGEQLLDLAHQRCPYSKATRGNIAVDLVLA